MLDDVKRILSMDVSEVIASDASLTLINCASKLYFNGRIVGCCASSQQQYYQMLKQNGIELATKFDMVGKRTCVPTRDGITDRKGVGLINWKMVDDEQATEMLIGGHFLEEDFEVLPEMYLEMRDEAAPEAKKRGRKHKN